VLTAPLPVAVIAGMMGVTAERHADFKRWSNAIVGIQDAQIDQQRIADFLELRSYFAAVAAERREAPGDDLVSALTKAREQGDTLTDEQVVAFCMLLMLAGNETTTNLLGNLINRIAAAPQDWAALRADPDLIEGAIEESLRVDSPAQMVIRRATEDVAIGAETIRAGDRVMVYLASANRDPARFPDPNHFDPERRDNEHFGWGSGIHTCMGGPLARLEVNLALETFLRRVENPRLVVDPPPYRQSQVFRGPRHLLVDFDLISD